MKKIIYHLPSCSTCQRIIGQLPNAEQFELHDIKSQGVPAKALDEMKEKVGSYEALFSKRAMKYRSLGLNEMELSEADYRKHILEEYTFLKRPVIQIGEDLFVGSAKKTVVAAIAAAT